MERVSPQHQPKGRTVVTIGSFDGVHRGHQALLQAARGLARELSAAMVCITFDPHPLAVLKGPIDGHLLTATDAKLDYLSEYGAEWVQVLPFTAETARVSPLAFLERNVGGMLNAAGVVVGYNFTFGAAGAGTPDTIRQWAAAGNRQVRVVPPVRLADGTAVSSSLIRGMIRHARMEDARAALGHPYAVQGKSVAGDGRGRQLGYPTANVIPATEQCMPPYGVYGGVLALAAGHCPAVANWGVRPTFDGERPVLEVHALNLPADTDLRGTPIRFEFHWHIRAERRFASVEQLVQQITADVDTVRRRFASHPSAP